MDRPGLRFNLYLGLKMLYSSCGLGISQEPSLACENGSLTPPGETEQLSLSHRFRAPRMIA